MKPFFPLKVVKGDDYSIFNPVDNQDYDINLGGYRILELCDGNHRVQDIAASLSGELGDSQDQALAYVSGFLDDMTILGMLFWRDQPVFVQPNWPAPDTVFWDITGACNLRCLHCYGGDDAPPVRELTTGEALRVIDEMAACGVGSISFSGGEPLLRQDFVDLADHACSQGFNSVGVATNGTLIDGVSARRLKESGINVQVSIDGDTAKVHDRMRGVPGSFDLALRGIRLLQEAGCEVSVCTSVSSINVERVPAIIKLMEQIGVAKYRVQGMVAMGRGKDNQQRLRLSPARMKELVAYLEARQIQISSYNFTLKPPPAEAPDFCSTGACSAGSTICSITTEGRVVPCTYFWGLNGDDLREHSFRWIWENSRLLNYFRTIRLDDVRGVCRDCDWLSICHGGCKAENFSAGDLFASNRSCWVADEHRGAAAGT